MYIKIGNTNIKYSSGVDDFMIFSEIPDSQLSYEKPILVRTKDELDIWFGRDFTDRNYFDELIMRGVTLYLYKPIKENNTHDIDDYIDIDSYYIFPEIFLQLPNTGESGYRYYLKNLPLEKHYYTFRVVDSVYKWVSINEGTLDSYTLSPVTYRSIYNLPRTGNSQYAYYVENVPSERYWYKFENNTWSEITDSLENYIPKAALFAGIDSLPQSGTYRYHVLENDTWWVWRGDKWIETIESNIQEFPIYFNTFSDLPWPGDNYRYFVVSEWCIWLSDSWTPESIFPQNLDNISGSLNNRDTLMISKPDTDQSQYTPYSYPEFRLYEDNHLGVFSREYELDNDKLNLSDSDLSDVNLGYKTLAFKLEYIQPDLDEGYIIINSKADYFSRRFNYEFKKGYNYCFWSISEPINKPSANYFRGPRFEISTVDDLIEVYSSVLGYKVVKTGDSEYLIYTDSLIDFTEFYTYKNINLVFDFDDTHNIITEYTKNSKGIEFYSKTIGTAWTNSENNSESLITVNIENPDYEKYRITIGRYDYFEIWEGPIFTDIGEERIDNLINNNSKLVMCDLSGLKNYITQDVYKGLISDEYLENNDFGFRFKIYKQHYYTPEFGEIGYKYKVYDGVWRIWENNEWSYITSESYNFYNFEEIVLQYPSEEILFRTEGNSMSKYYTEDTGKWWIWTDGEWTELTKEILPGEEYVIRVDKVGYETYTIHVVAGDFSDTYTGNLFDLQDIICNSESEIFSEFRFKNLCNSLRTGTYTLRRGKNENQTKDMYLKSLDCLFDTQVENVFPDFFLVPDITKYTDKDTSHKDAFLEHAKDFNCQFLIQNNNPQYKIVNIGTKSFSDPSLKPYSSMVLYEKTYQTGGTEYRVSKDGENLEEFTDQEVIEISTAGGDFINNYTKDISNYLVYFFRPLTLYGYSRPAYYVFLNGLLSDVYSMTETEINYDSPLESDPYEIDPNSLANSLEKYKSNFLVNNNHIYYYKKYFGGIKPETTVWMRFVVSKVYRELQKNRWGYLSQKSLGVIETEIRNTLERIQNKFSIVDYIILTKFSPEMSKNYLELGIETAVRDLMNNNMTLDITVNYNELNTYGNS